MIFKFKQYIPVIHPSSFIHPLASVTGNVIIGKNVFVGSGAAVRGDFGKILIADGCNIQENCVIHTFPGVIMRLKNGAHIGHGAIVHGASIGKNVLVGMHAVIMDNVTVGDDCIIGAMSLITEGCKFPNGKIILGNPAKVIKDVPEEMLKWKIEGTKIYQNLVKECLNEMEETEPLRNGAPLPSKQKRNYKTWKNTKK